MQAVVYTLGCKTNQYESQAIMKKLFDYGYQVSDKLEKADLYVVNTCAVTGEAERKSRQVIHKINELNSEADIIVLGCSTQNNSEKFSSLKGVVMTGGTRGKLDVIDAYLNNNCNYKLDISNNDYEDNLVPYRSRTRAYIKVQDGCNKHCTYCIVPLLRGRSRSRPFESIKQEIESCGCKEIVLGGIDLSDYNYDGLDFTGLVGAVGALSGRIRISSLSVRAVNRKLLDTMKAGNYCPHFHLSVQNGCDEILKKMNRHYTSTDIINACDLIREYYPDAAITTDLIVGFPYETEEYFTKSMQTLERAKLTYMHIFPYSIRAGTPAAKMPQIDKAVKKERVKRLEVLREKLWEQFLQDRKDDTVSVLTEQKEGEYVTGHSQNYIKIYLPQDTPLDTIVNVRVGEKFLEGAKGDIIN